MTVYEFTGSFDQEEGIGYFDVVFDDDIDLEYESWLGEEEPQEHLKAAIDAAIKKSYCYHCRSPHYIRPKDECRKKEAA